tara:strand:- start:53 stop:565 length:513 start_codon:yes stop_codon:yes gene_type:complete
MTKEEQNAKHQHLPSVGSFIATESGYVYPAVVLDELPNAPYPELGEWVPVLDCDGEWWSALSLQDACIVNDIREQLAAAYRPSAFNLYLVGRTDEVDYDETVSVVVRASCESDARRLVTHHASGDEARDSTWSEGFRGEHFWFSEASFVTLLASGVEGGEGIVCRDFNAG